jgi:hypothetical protein
VGPVESSQAASCLGSRSAAATFPCTAGECTEPHGTRRMTNIIVIV